MLDHLSLRDPINWSRPTCKIPGASADTAPTGLSVQERIHSFFSPIRHSATEPYVDASGKKFDLKDAPKWRDRLGKKVLIVDIDTREPKNVNEMLNPNGIQLVSGAIFGHFLYGEYRHIRSEYRMKLSLLDSTNTRLRLQVFPGETHGRLS